MLTAETKRHIDAARQVLVGVVPNPTSQIDQITNALIYKFMDDMDQSAIRAGGSQSFFIEDLEKYAWTRLMDSRLGNQERMNLYSEALIRFSQAKQLPELFRNIFKSAFLPYRSPEVLGLFLKEINYFDYAHPEHLGDGNEYLLSIMSSQGDAGQFRTPRHIIDFIVDAINPTKDDRVLDPACGTGGFLISSYKHILEQHDGKNDSEKKEKLLTPDDRKKLFQNFEGYDIDPGMVRIAQVNMYLHQFKNPKIFQYDTLGMDERWNDKFDVILANPPFMSPKGGVRPHNKFSVQSSRSEVLFVDYIMNHLKPKGRAGVIVPEGIIFQSGSAHKQLRKNLVNDGLYAVVSLPSGVFQPYSGVKTSILLLDNEIAKQRSEILFVNIKNTGFSLTMAQREIDKNDIPQAIKVIKQFKEGCQITPTKLAFTTNKEAIVSKGYDLSLSKYVPLLSNGSKKMVDLSEVCDIQKGKSSSTKTLPGPYPLILTAEESKSSDHFDFDDDGVAVPLISATGHGKASIKRVHSVSGKFALANLLAFVKPLDKLQLNSRYLYYVLDSAKESMAELMQGAANVSMKVTDLSAFQIPLPPLEVQKQIVAELDGYAGIIAGAKQIAQNWKPRIEIDPKWEKVKLGEVCEIGSSKRVFESEWKSEGVPFYRAREIVKLAENNFVDNELFISEEMFADYSKKYGQPKEGDLMVTGVGTLGICYRVKKGDRFYFKDGNIIWLKEFSDIANSHFIELLYKTDFVKDQIKAGAAGGTVGTYTITNAKNTIIPLPPLEIQKQIVEQIEAERALVESAKKLIDIYEQKTKDTIAKLWEE